MSELQIKTESLPQRCDICHKSDLFDPMSAICKRCENISLDKINNKLESNKKGGGLFTFWLLSAIPIVLVFIFMVAMNAKKETVTIKNGTIVKGYTQLGTTMPEIIKKTQPRYTEEAKKNKIKGKVVLS